MRKTLLAFFAAMAAFVALTVPAHAVDVVVPDLASAPTPEAVACEPPNPNEGGAVWGTGDWSPPVTTVRTAHSVAMHLTALCDKGTDRMIGSYSFGMSGTSSEDCAAGTGNFSYVSGSGPIGTFTGKGSFKKVGIHYYIDLDVTARDGKQYHADLWVDLEGVFHQGEYCFYDHAYLFGHGAIRRTK